MWIVKRKGGEDIKENEISEAVLQDVERVVARGLDVVNIQCGSNRSIGDETEAC